MNAPRTPILDAIDQILAHETPAVAWLRKAGPIARRLNEEAARDNTDEGESE